MNPDPENLARLFRIHSETTPLTMNLIFCGIFRREDFVGYLFVYVAQVMILSRCLASNPEAAVRANALGNKKANNFVILNFDNKILLPRMFHMKQNFPPFQTIRSPSLR